MQYHLPEADLQYRLSQMIKLISADKSNIFAVKNFKNSNIDLKVCVNIIRA